MKSKHEKSPNWEDALSLAERTFASVQALGTPEPVASCIRDSALRAYQAVFRSCGSSNPNVRDLEEAERRLLDLRAALLLADRLGGVRSKNGQPTLDEESDALLSAVRASLHARSLESAKPVSGGDAERGDSMRRHREIMEELRKMGGPSRPLL